MILVKRSKYLWSLLFCTRDLGFVVCWCCFVKRRLFSRYKRHFTIVKRRLFSPNKRNFSVVEKYASFKKGITHDYGQQFQISFGPTFLFKRPWFCHFIMLFCQKEAFLSIKTTIYYSRRICIFWKRVNPCFWSELPNIFRA